MDASRTHVRVLILRLTGEVEAAHPVSKPGLILNAMFTPEKQPPGSAGILINSGLETNVTLIRESHTELEKESVGFVVVKDMVIITSKTVSPTRLFYQKDWQD